MKESEESERKSRLELLNMLVEEDVWERLQMHWLRPVAVLALHAVSSLKPNRSLADC